MIDTAFLNNRIGRYEVQERIGKGGMAQVYRARDTNLDRVVAIKVLHEHLSDDPTFKERFEREAKFVGSFNHPNIVQIYDFDSFERNGQRVYYMVMPYVPGNTLRDLLEEMNGKPLPSERALQIALNLADALNYAHERGMVHRDVKPGNILFDERGQAVLTDFGIARLVASSNLTQEGLTVGTPAYMSPEQVAGEALDARSDIYALGVIVYEMLAGHTPFHDDNSVSVLLKTLNEPVPPLSKSVSLPHPMIDAVVLKALAKDPQDRYQTALEFADDLKTAFKGGSVTASMPVISPKTNSTTTVERPTRATRTIQLMTQQIKTVTRSPSAILGIGMAIIIILLIAGLLRNSATVDEGDETSGMTDESAMTGPYYFTSSFDANDETLSNWPQESQGPIEREVMADGNYRLMNHRNNFAMPTIFNPETAYRDVTISMKAVLTPDSAPASGYGIIFRYLDNDNYNTFTVDGLGRFSIWTRKDGQWTELRGVSERWTENSQINPVGEPNELTVDVVGDKFTAYVNGATVVEIRDATFAEGAVGIYVASTSESKTDVLVDMFSVGDIADSMSGAMTQEDGPEVDGR